MKLEYSKDTPEGYIKIKEDSKLICLLNEENKVVAVVEYLEGYTVRETILKCSYYNTIIIIRVVADNKDLELFILKVLRAEYERHTIFTVPNITYESYYIEEVSFFEEENSYIKYSCDIIQGNIFGLDKSKICLNQNDSLIRYYIWRLSADRFGSMRIKSDFKLLLFHGGSCSLPINRINFLYHGSEYGNGFYCAFNPRLPLEHRNQGCHIFSVYKLDLLGVFKNCNVGIGYNSNSDIIFALGSSWCSSRGGQLVIKNSSVLPYLEYVDSYDRVDFNTLYKAGRFDDEYKSWDGIFEF